MKKCIVLIWVSLILIISCGKTPESTMSNNENTQKLRIVYWSLDSDVEGMRPWIVDAKKRFEVAYPNVEVELLETISQDEYFTKTALMLQAGEQFDGIVVGDFMIKSYVSANYLAPLPIEGWADYNNFFDGAKNATVVDGKTYAVQYTGGLSGLFYSIPLLQKAGVISEGEAWEPKNWSDIESAAVALANIGVKYPYYLGMPASDAECASMHVFQNFLTGTNDRLYENGKWVAESPGFLDSLKFLETLYHKDKISSEIDLSVMVSGDPFMGAFEKMAQGEDYGIILQGNWNEANLRKGNPNYVDYVGVAPMPKQHGNGFTAVAGGWTYAIPSTSVNQELAFEFLKMVVDYDGISLMTSSTGDMVTRSDVAKSDDYVEHGIFNVEMTGYLDFAEFRPAYDEYPQISKIVSDVTLQVVLGLLTPEAAMKQYSDSVIQLIGPERTIKK